MNKGKIVIASILKPVNDTRLFEKFGLSLSQTNKYEVNIIGFYTKKIVPVPNITFYPVFKFQRLTLKRLFASLKYYKILLKVKPDIIIVTTAELLPFTCLYKILFGSKISYDVQENYYRNIRYTKTYPAGIKFFLATAVRAVEWMSKPLIDQYFLAEQCYTYELNFPKHRLSVVQNKFKPLAPIQQARSLSNKPHIRFLYTGTIALNYGILEAIHFTKNISKIYPYVSLEIIGYAPKAEVFKLAKQAIGHASFVKLPRENAPIPHAVILQAISHADFALLPYQPDKSIENCFPTKIWEYMAYRLPMIIQNHAPWVEYCEEYQACIDIDFNNYVKEDILNRILEEKFYQKELPNEIFWLSEELTLLEAIHNLINDK